MAEAAKIIGRAINKDVAYVQMPYEEHTRALVCGECLQALQVH